MGNYLIGNVRFAYGIARKAKNAIPIAKKNSAIVMNIWPGEDKINEILERIESRFPTIIGMVDEDEIDENQLDFSNVEKIYPQSKDEAQMRLIEIDDLDEETFLAVFSGMARNRDELVYFDRVAGDVLSYVQGYFSSFLGDQTSANKALADKIISNATRDYVDEDRYVLIPRLVLSDFINHYTNVIGNNGIFRKFIDSFSVEVLKVFEDNDNVTTTSDLVFSHTIREKFTKYFYGEFASQMTNPSEEFEKYYGATAISISKNWIEKIL